MHQLLQRVYLNMNEELSQREYSILNSQIGKYQHLKYTYLWHIMLLYPTVQRNAQFCKI